jgi:hypothetical protein
MVGIDAREAEFGYITPFGIAFRSQSLSIHQFMPLHQVTSPLTIQRLLRCCVIRVARRHANTLGTVVKTGHETRCTARFGRASLWKDM